MSSPLAPLRAEAEALARELDSPQPGARTASAVHAGSAGRRRSGSGEHFWQYRHHAAEDSPSRIDWRRSARGDALFVRETELETARTFHLWADPHPGFDWASGAAACTKAHRARVLLLALAARLSRDGERIGVVGGQPPAFGGQAIDRLAGDMLRLKPDGRTLPVPKSPGIALIASDFYDPKPEWRERLAPLARQCPAGLLLSVADPTELSFDFAGRVEFRRPGSDERRLVERAENLRETYALRLEAHRTGLRELAAQLGWHLVEHTTADPALPAAHALARALEDTAGKSRRVVS